MRKGVLPACLNCTDQVLETSKAGCIRLLNNYRDLYPFFSHEMGPNHLIHHYHHEKKSFWEEKNSTSKNAWQKQISLHALPEKILLALLWINVSYPIYKIFHGKIFSYHEPFKRYTLGHTREK